MLKYIHTCSTPKLQTPVFIVQTLIVTQMSTRGYEWHDRCEELVNARTLISMSIHTSDDQ